MLKTKDTSHKTKKLLKVKYTPYEAPNGNMASSCANCSSGNCNGGGGGCPCGGGR